MAAKGILGTERLAGADPIVLGKRISPVHAIGCAGWRNQQTRATEESPPMQVEFLAPAIPHRAALVAHAPARVARWPRPESRGGHTQHLPQTRCWQRESAARLLSRDASSAWRPRVLYDLLRGSGEAPPQPEAVQSRPQKDRKKTGSVNQDRVDPAGALRHRTPAGVGRMHRSLALWLATTPGAF